MQKGLIGSFLVLGITSLVAQVLAVRELLVIFYGNEFFMGWTLFAWLFWVAVGALLAGRITRRCSPCGLSLAGCHAWAALALPLVLMSIRAARSWVTPVAGAMPDLLPAMGFSFMVLAPLCGGLGAQFVIGVHAWQNREPTAATGAVPGWAYGLETAGFVVGGLLFNFMGVLQDEFLVAGWLGTINGVAGLAGVFAWGGRSPRSRRMRLGLRCGLLGVTAASLALAILGSRLGHMTGAWRYPGQELIESRHSIHGNLAVTSIGSQLNFHSNGLLLGAEDEPLSSETLVHYPMLWHPQPQRVLLMGNGFNGALGEILKHAPRRVDYVELDPVLIQLVRQYAAPVRRAALEDSRVHVTFTDGRFYFHHAPEGAAAGVYDVVMINLPSPSTILLNRYYTQEFYRDVRRRLAPHGVLAVRLAFSPDYLGPELETLGASVYRTLRDVFASVRLLPGYDVLFLATAAEAPPPTAADLAGRYEARGLDTDFVFPPAIVERLETDRIGYVQDAFDANTLAQINRDGQPVACHYNLVVWLRSFHPWAAAVAERVGGLGWPWGAGVVLLAGLGMSVSMRGRAVWRAGVWAKGIGSFTLMGCELVLLMAFQSLCGYLHYQLALMLAALMLGMALGTGMASRRIVRAGIGTLGTVHAGLAAYAVGLVVVLRWLESAAPGPSLGLELLFLLLAAGVGVLAGYEFPVATRIHLAGDASSAHQSGTIYVVDLVGSCLSALGVGLWALPIIGTGATLGLLAGLNVIVAVLCRRVSES
ncbi:MAG: hypothetical protein PHO14_10495 [Kiritimatiellae bacterium]|nr:hypothetical protein [Kiritimatiellia bacterium]MDD4342642.1 hypothetical protein [Kiritimatiellia bacterium]